MQIQDFISDIKNPTGPGLFSRIIAVLKTKWMERKIKQNLKIDEVLSIIKDNMQSGITPVTSFGDPRNFPNIQKHLDECKINIENYAKLHNASPENQVEVCIGVGDSIMDFFRNHSSNIPNEMNFGFAGSFAIVNTYVIEYLAPILAQNNLKVTTVVLGCLIGNFLLGHGDFDAGCRDATDTMRTARVNWPSARLIVYSMPPVFDIYAMKFQIPAFMFFVNHIRNVDNNAVYLDIWHSFAGPFGIFPKASCSIDGIHMSPESQFIFDAMITNGKSIRPGGVLTQKTM